MRAAAEQGTSIPKLCATDSLESFGSCRLCLVEIDGRRGTPASCTTPIEPGMTVHTQTPLTQKLREGVMELYISDHPLDCLTCAANGDCDLQGTLALTMQGRGWESKISAGFASDNLLGCECVSCGACGLWHQQCRYLRTRLPFADRLWPEDDLWHHPDTQANVVTTDYSDWATNCPEYKVTAVQISASNGPTDWQEYYKEQAERARRIIHVEAAE